jgi:hypothetical protein
MDSELVAALRDTGQANDIRISQLVRYAIRAYFGQDVPFRPEPLQVADHAE